MKRLLRRRRAWRGAGFVLAAMAAGAGDAAARAQEERLLQLPDTAAERVVAFYNAATTIRLSGESQLAAGARIIGNVAVLGGPFTVRGTVEGDVIVINGDLRLEPGAVITGSVTVVGGDVTDDGGRIGEELMLHPEPLRFRHDADGLVYAPDSFQSTLSAGREFGFGRTDFLIAARRDYNRVEGLPIAIGPRIRIGDSNPTMLEALAIYRSSAGLRIDPDRMGYALRAEQFLGGGRTARLGLALESEIIPIENAGLSDRENALATFVLHTDYRDAFEREGWLAYLRFARAGWPHDFTVEYRDERHRSVTTASPWSLFDNAETWRPEPVVAEGTLRSVAGRMVYDTRNEVVSPATGWHITVSAEQGIGGRLTEPGFAYPGETDTTAVPASRARTRFTSGELDVRRYARISPGARMAVRAFAAGSVNGGALPAQRQWALGGEGTLPGYALHEFDCGARRRIVTVDDSDAFPYYGCDRIALVQIEYQATLPVIERISLGSGFGLEYPVRWVAFFDAGRAWNEPDALDGRERGANDFSADAGIGLRIGSVGAYLAVPLSSGGHGVNFFIRLGRRL
ncbi:MAG: BamA/TamA family outer membrane protein [Gemmatimonadetes bacterium]|nr:BamA/TamA family outer membrane protein [Gemmatimonadota bacterium]